MKIRMLRAIESHPSAARSRNPYRMIPRRYVPEPMLALLIFIMGVWLWDNHFGPSADYDEETCRMTLVKADRDLRLASGAMGMPAPLRRAIDIPTPEQALQAAVDNLDFLGKRHALNDEGVYALIVLHSLKASGSPPPPGIFGKAGVAAPEALEISKRFARGTDRWWDVVYLRGITALGGPDLLPAAALDADRNYRLVIWAACARGGALALTLMGIGFVPRALRASAAALRSRSHGYTGAWSPGLGLGVFLLSYLASIGFSMGIERLIRGPGDGSSPVLLSMPVLLALDTASKLVPALVALALLFRRGSHAISRLGLRKLPDVGLVLGMFALLTASDKLLRPLLGGFTVPDPAGGLSSLEAGGWGMAFAFVSACLAAPVTEEILYRGVLFQTLSNRIRVPAATLVSAAVFAIVHFYDAYGVVSVGLFGVASALCFRSRGALSTSILLHVFYNSVIKFPEWIVYHAAL